MPSSPLRVWPWVSRRFQYQAMAFSCYLVLAMDHVEVDLRKGAPEVGHTSRALKGTHFVDEDSDNSPLDATVEARYS
jgi:hypothetical protein